MCKDSCAKRGGGNNCNQKVKGIIRTLSSMNKAHGKT